MDSKSDNILTVSASTENLADVRNFVAESARTHGLSEKDIDEIRLAVDEAFTNIVKHAYNYDKAQNVSLKTGVENASFWISICDQGKPYDPTSYTEPNIAERIKQGKRGGVGVYLIKKLMDKVEYKSIGSTNQIRLIKHL
ncbi:ATP-binding protein [bacterium]|nr:MAG: ATP-binding protein [bacterium]